MRKIAALIVLALSLIVNNAHAGTAVLAWPAPTIYLKHDPTSGGGSAIIERDIYLETAIYDWSYAAHIRRASSQVLLYSGTYHWQCEITQDFGFYRTSCALFYPNGYVNTLPESTFWIISPGEDVNWTSSITKVRSFP